MFLMFINDLLLVTVHLMLVPSEILMNHISLMGKLFSFPCKKGKYGHLPEITQGARNLVRVCVSKHTHTLKD